MAAESREGRLVALFESIHHVLAAERALRQGGVWCDLVPVPRELSSDCGMAIEIRLQDLGAARSVLLEAGARCRGLYHRRPGGYEEVPF